MPPNPPENPAARGRAIASKPLNASSTAPKVRSAVASTSSRSSRTPSVASSKSSATGATSSAASAVKTTPSGSGSRASSRGSESGGFKVTKLSSTTVTLNTTWTPRPLQPTSSEPPQVSVAEQQPMQTSDPLQIAAQAYPWAYMTSTLDACFNTTEATAKGDLETRTKEISEEESDVAEQRDRLEAERALDFFEELGSSTFAKDAPAIMQLFHSHGDSCARIETEALKLAMRSSHDPEDEEPLKPYSDMLHTLEELQIEAKNLQDSIIKLSESTPLDDATNTSGSDASEASSQVSSVFASCLPVMRARIANLSMAQDLIDTALENISLGLRMESMGLA